MASSSSTGPSLPLGKIQSNNRSSNAYQAPATPYQSPQHTEQSHKHSAMFNKVADAKRRTGAQYDDFYSDEDVMKFSPNGWPRIAATQMYMPNYNSHRGFSLLTHYILTNYELKISCIENKLYEMDFEDADGDGELLRSLPFNRDQFIDRCLQGTPYPSPHDPEPSTGKLDRATQRDNLIMSASVLVKEYKTHRQMQTEDKKLPRVSRRAHEVHFKTAQNLQGLNDEACAFMRYMDDFICGEPDYIFQRFEHLLYTKSRWLADFLKHLCCLFCFDSLPSSQENDDPRVAYSLRGFERFFKVLLSLSCLSLLIVPVSILYLKTDWSRPVYLTVVVVSSTVFCFVMTAFESRTAPLLVGLAAFFAVLVTFLSNNMSNSGVA